MCEREIDPDSERGRESEREGGRGQDIKLNTRELPAHNVMITVQ